MMRMVLSCACAANETNSKAKLNKATLTVIASRIMLTGIPYASMRAQRF